MLMIFESVCIRHLSSQLPDTAGRQETLREQDTRALLVFEMKCLRAILGVTRLERPSNARIRQTLGIRQTIEDCDGLDM